MIRSQNWIDKEQLDRFKSVQIALYFSSLYKHSYPNLDLGVVREAISYSF
jgi:hypothetical protein